MDTRIRKNEKCIIGLPRCDYVFSSTRSCFIAYGFNDSTLEKSILSNILASKGIEPIEAEGALAPGQYAFCTKICSKIIQSQFCIVLINNEIFQGREIPNANVNMEYGLMLGFNKLVLPFQKQDQKLPFNVAGLDTTKYEHRTFEHMATKVIDDAIVATTQDEEDTIDHNQRLTTFLLSKKALLNPLISDDERNMFQLGKPLGYNLLTDFAGNIPIFFGNFTAFSEESVLWRLQVLQQILKDRSSSLPSRCNFGLINDKQHELAVTIFKNIQIWILVTQRTVRDSIKAYASKNCLPGKVSVYCIEDVENELEILYI